MFAEPDGSAIPGTREANAQSASGETLRVVWNNDLVRDEDGTPRYAVMTGVDVTAERTTAGLMTNLFQAGISTAIIGIDSRGRITLFNAGAAGAARLDGRAGQRLPVHRPAGARGARRAHRAARRGVERADRAGRRGARVPADRLDLARPPPAGAAPSR